MELIEKQISPSSPTNLDSPTEPESLVGSQETEANRGAKNGTEAKAQCPPHTTERKLMARVDLHVLPILCFIYFLAFLDRVNIGNAVIFNMKTDLDLQGFQYNTALMVFFVPYILFEIPSNVLLKKFKPHIWLSGCIFLFGLTMTLQGLVQNFSGLVATRFFLGLFESGVFPGCFYVISMWYKRSEAQRRFTFFFGSTTLAGAFGGLLASAIGKMDGVRGYHGWRWIFILEGILTCVTACAAIFLIPNFPEEAKWLREDERAYIEARLRDEHGLPSGKETRTSPREILAVFNDLKIFLGGFMYFGIIVTAYGFAYFSPTIIHSYGYTAIETQLHSVPPYAAGFVLSMILALFSDLSQHRLLFTLFSTSLSAIGFTILLCIHHHRRTQYGALFLVAMGYTSAMPLIICWFSMNTAGHRRRAVATAWQIGFGNAGGIVATYAFVDATHFYRTGYLICLAFVGLSAAASLTYGAACWCQNRNRRRVVRAEGEGGVDGVIADDEQGRAARGDLNPEFRYLL